MLLSRIFAIVAGMHKELPGSHKKQDHYIPDTPTTARVSIDSSGVVHLPVPRRTARKLRARA